MVFGELVSGEVDVRIWIHPEHRKRGYGTAALRKSRSEMAVVLPRRADGRPRARRQHPAELLQDRRYVSDIAERDHGRLSGNSKPLAAYSSGVLCTVVCQPRSVR